MAHKGNFSEILEWLKKYVKINNPIFLDESDQINFKEICWLDPQGRIKFDLDVDNVTITGDLENFNLPLRGHKIKFANFSGLFQIENCPNLVDLSGIPEEIYTDSDNSALFIENCESLETWDKSYCPGGAPRLRISSCHNLRTITLGSSYVNVIEMNNLKSLTKFVSKSDDKNCNFLIFNCKALDPKNIELTLGRIWMENCQKLECEVEGMEAEVFNKIKLSKNLQRGKDLGLF